MMLTEEEKRESGTEFHNATSLWSIRTLEKINQVIREHEKEGKNRACGSLSGLYNDVLTIEIDKLRKKIMDDFYGNETKFGIPDMIKKVCDYYGVDVDIINDISRRRVIVEPRQLIHWMLRNRVVENNLSLNAIGQITGGQDHGTVIHSCKTINNRVRFETEFRADVMILCNSLGMKTRFNGHQITFHRLNKDN